MIEARKFEQPRSRNVSRKKTSAFVSPRAWMTKVGTRTEDRISLMSIWVAIRTTAMAAAGLAPNRSKRPHQAR